MHRRRSLRWPAPISAAAPALQRRSRVTAPDPRATLSRMTRHTYRFGDYRIDLSARELHGANGLATLSPKVFDCLAYLLEHRDRAVGRDELIAAVWGKVDVTDTLLGQTVLKARRAIGDTGGEQNAIRTIPRFGYRWIAELALDAELEEPASRLAPAADPSTDPEPPHAAAQARAAAPAAELPSATAARRARAAVPGALALLAGTLTLAVLVAHFRPAPTPPQTATSETGKEAARGDAIAVLPVAVDAGEEWGWLRLGLMDLVGSRLRRGGQVVVPSDNVVASARADFAHHTDAATQPANADPSAAIRERTGAHYAIVPSITRTGRYWQMRLELVGADGRHEQAQAQGDDPIEAAQAASDRLLSLLGKSPPPEDDSRTGLSLTDLVQRVEAALLVDDFAAARHLIEAAPAAQRDAPLVRLRLAQIDFRIGNAEAAQASLQALLAQTSAETDPLLRARILHTLGAIAIRNARGADAAEMFGQAIRLSEPHKDPGVLGKSYAGLGSALRDLQRFDESADALANARVALTLAGDTLALVTVDDNEALLDNARGRPAEALAPLQRAADTLRRFGIVNDLALVVSAQIDTHLLLLDPLAALKAADGFLPQRPLITNPRGRNSFDLRHARALAASGRLRAARALLDEIAKSPVAAQQAGILGAVAFERATLDLANGHADAAVTSARSAMQQLQQIDQADTLANVWLLFTRALRAAGQAAEAHDQVAQFERWVRANPGLARGRLLALLAEAEQLWSDQRRDDAWQAYAAALDLVERGGVPEDVAIVVTSYGNALITDNDLPQATAVVGRAARWAEQSFECAVLQARLYRALHEPQAWQSALTRARALAGERAIPASASASMQPLDHDPG